MDPLYLLVTLALTVLLFFACLINAGADPAPAGAPGHGPDPDTRDPDEAHGHGGAGHDGEVASSHGH